MFDRLPERVARNIVVGYGGACWMWMGFRTWFGYGQHREVYKALRGPIPRGLCIDHLCGEKLCVNPEHLEVVTRSENSKRNVDGRVLAGSGRKWSRNLPPARVRLTAHVAPEVRARLKKQAAGLGVSMSEMARRIVLAALAKEVGRAE